MIMGYPSSRNINDLCPQMRALFVRFSNAMAQAGYDFIVTCTYRNNEDQTALYNQGRVNSKPIVTNAKAGESKHNCVDSEGKPASQAFDIVLMTNGKPDWDRRNPKWRLAGKIGTSVGLEWAGNWPNFSEYPHFQLPKE